MSRSEKKTLSQPHRTGAPLQPRREEGNERGAAAHRNVPVRVCLVMFAGAELALIPARKREDSAGARSCARHSRAHPTGTGVSTAAGGGVATHASTAAAKVPPLGETIVRLDNRRLVEVPEEVLERRACRTLSLCRNDIVAVPPAIATSLRQLTRLLLSNNAIASLPPEIGHVRTLRELYVVGAMRASAETCTV